MQAHAASGLPRVPRTDLAPGLSISRVIKGNWQLSGGHKCAFVRRIQLHYGRSAAHACTALA